MRTLILALVVGFASHQNLQAQSGIIGAGFSSGWSNPANILSMSASAGGSQIITRNASGTGNQYFRLVRNGGTEMSPSASCTGGQDAAISSSSSAVISIANAGNCGNGAWYLNAPNTTDNYVFKVPSINSSTSFVYFRIQGTVRTVNNVSQSPLSTNVYPGQDVTVTATLSGAFATGQAAYLRYSADNWTSSAVVQMSGSGTTYSGVIPGWVHVSGSTIRYYVFTGGTANVQSDGSNADYFTINLNNNGGSNYSYTIVNGWASATDGNWSDASTWAANAVPPTSGMGAVQINSNVTLDQNAAMTTLNLNGGTLTLAGSNTFSVSGTATVASGATLQNSSSIASNVAIANFVVSNGGSYVHETVGSSGNGTSTDFPGSTSRSFGTTSTVTIKKWADGGGSPVALPASGSPGWGNLTIDVASLGGMWKQSGSITNVQGDLSIKATGGRELRLQEVQTGSVNTLPSITIAGDLFLSGGILSVLGGSTSGSGSTLRVYLKGDLSISGGTLYLTGTNGFTNYFFIFLNYCYVYLEGDLNIYSPGKLTQTKASSVVSGLDFAKASGTQYFNSYNGGIDSCYVGFWVGDGTTTNTLELNANFKDIKTLTVLPSQFRIWDKATLNTNGEYYIGGVCDFQLDAGGTLKMGSASGITALGNNSGNVRTTSSRTYNSAAHYVYNGTYDQVTGNGLPITITGSLAIDNSGSANDNIVTLTTNNTETDLLNLTQGYFAAGTNQTLKISNTGAINGTGGGDCVYLTANGGNIHLLGNNTVTGISSGHPYFYDVTIGNNIANSPSTFSQNGTIYHYCTINTQGSVNPNAPTYATGSTLIYNPGGTYNRNIEWGNVSGSPGYPWHVRVQNSTTLNLGTNAVSPSELELGGDLYIGTSTSGSNIVTLNALSKPLTVKGDLYIGNAPSTFNELKLSTVYGGDLWLYGNFTRYTNNNYYADNNRAIFFKGTANSTISTPSATGQNFSYALADKSTGTETITLSTPVGITQMMTFTKGIVNTDAANLLTISNTSTGAVSGGSSLSYVNGPVKRFTSTSAAGAYVFPVGKTTAAIAYRPVTLTTISNLSAGSPFTGEYFYLDPPTAGSDVFLSNLTGIQKNEYWQLDRNAGSTTGKISFTYTDPGTNNWRDASGASISPCSGCYVGVVKRSASSGAGNWDFTDATTALSTAGTPPELRLSTSNGDLVSSEVTSFSPFTTGFYYNVILPVQLLEFKGRLQNGDAVLDWKVADTRDLQSFELQYSRDGRSFSKLAVFAGASAPDYGYTDPSLIAGQHFYRLLIREKNGSIKYSQVILLSVGKAQTRVIGLRQNPVKDIIQIQIVSAAAQQAHAVLSDVQGRVFGQLEYGLANGLNQWTIPASYLAHGAYFLRLSTADGVLETLRFIKE